VKAPAESADPAGRERRLVWIVGPAPWSAGGVAAVTRLLLSSSLGERYRLLAMPTHAAGSLPARVARGVRGMARVLLGLFAERPALAHVKVASRGSFYRKLAVVALLRAARVPAVVHVHGGGFDAFVRAAPAWVHAAARWMIEGAPAAVTLSTARLEMLRPLFPRAAWSVIPNPVEAAALAPLAAERYHGGGGRVGGPLRLLFLGDVVERKGVADLLRALAALRAEGRPQLVVAGPGEASRFRRLAAELGIAERVAWPGWVDEAAKRELLRAADVFVLPSHVEGVPLALLEAMASGLPSVVTPVGGVPDAVLAGETSLVVPAGDVRALARAIGRLVEDAPLRARLGARAQERARDFDVEVVAAQVARLYGQVLGDADHA
jgi:glycosyltransferase involved in cell wall biosynthesis